MQRTTLFFMLGALLSGCQAQAVGNLAEIAIIDRDTGVMLTPHYYHGEYWVAGRPGARYGIEIHNRSGERLLAVTSVDGLNVLNGSAAGFDQKGYIFSPRVAYQITGWRKNDAEVAAFTFTDVADSYAARTGQPANIGVIGVALFRERQVYAYDTPTVATPPAAGAPLAASAAPASAERSQRYMMSPADIVAQAAPTAQSVRPAPQLGTGHGEIEQSYVRHAEFVRMQPEPNEIIRIRYDSAAHLMAMGVIAQPRQQPPGIDAFPATHGEGYVPDPPG